jgi:hypothetical protein
MCLRVLRFVSPLLKCVAFIGSHLPGGIDRCAAWSPAPCCTMQRAGHITDILSCSGLALGSRGAVASSCFAVHPCGVTPVAWKSWWPTPCNACRTKWQSRSTELGVPPREHLRWHIGGLGFGLRCRARKVVFITLVRRIAIRTRFILRIGACYLLACADLVGPKHLPHQHQQVRSCVFCKIGYVFPLATDGLACVKDSQAVRNYAPGHCIAEHVCATALC